MTVRFHLPGFRKADGPLCRKLFTCPENGDTHPYKITTGLIDWQYLVDLLTAHWDVLDSGLYMTSADKGLTEPDVKLYAELFENEGFFNHVHMKAIAVRRPLQFYLAAKIIENWSRLIPCQTGICDGVTFYVTQDGDFDLCVYGPGSVPSLAFLDIRFSSKPLRTARVAEFLSWVFRGGEIRGIAALRKICEQAGDRRIP